MARIFISYAHGDKGVAEKYAKALMLAGHNVFWDVAIPPGVSWNEFIFRQLGESDVVVVLWSRESVGSTYVKEEAEFARGRNKLIPVKVEDVAPPFGFGQLHAVDMTGWSGSVNDARWPLVISAIERAQAPNSSANLVDAVAPLVEPASNAGLFIPSMWGVILLASAVLIAFGLFAARVL